MIKIGGNIVTRKLHIITRERENTCHYCGETRSVKYMIEELDIKPFHHEFVPYCNKCALAIVIGGIKK